MKGMILITLVLAASIVMMGGASAHQPSQDSLIQAALYGNSASNPPPNVYSQANITSALPQELFLQATSEGNSSISVQYENGTYVQNTTGAYLQDIPFANYYRTNITLPVGKYSVTITVQSEALNFTKPFTYSLNVLTLQQFINYENELQKKKPLNSPNGYYSIAEAAVIVIITGIMGTSASKITKKFFIISRHLSDFLVGARGR